MRERRRHRRITLSKPILGSVGNTPVFVLDASRGGLRVAHHAQLPDRGAICEVHLPTDGGRITLECAIVHTAMEHASAAAEQLFSTGLEIVSVDAESKRRLEALIGPDPIDK